MPGSGLARLVWVGLVCSCLSGGASAAAEAPSFDFHALQALIEEGTGSTVEDLLAALPATYRSHYVLVFSSRSLQQASMRDPRAIIYGGDAHLMVSFNGDPSQRGHDALETMEYDADTARFRLREIKPADSSASPRLQVSEVDPVRCRLCHGTPPRPLWDATPFWPSVYGERYRANLSAGERAGLSMFLRQQPTHPRYRSLPNAERLAYHGAFAPEAQSEYDDSGQEAPNAEFSRLLGRMNAQVIARELRTGRYYLEYRYALLGAAEGSCGSPADFLPSSESARVTAEFHGFTVRTADADRQRDESKRLRALNPSSRLGLFPVSLAASDDVTALRFLAEYALGLATQGWNLTFERSRADFRVSPEDGAALAMILRSEVALSDVKVRELALLRDYSAADTYCNYLRKRSRESLAAIRRAD